MFSFACTRTGGRTRSPTILRLRAVRDGDGTYYVVPSVLLGWLLWFAGFFWLRRVTSVDGSSLKLDRVNLLLFIS